MGSEGLSFASAWGFRKNSQSSGRFIASPLLKLVDPIRHRADHIARGFTRYISLYFDCGALLFALFDNTYWFFL